MPGYPLDWSMVIKNSCGDAGAFLLDGVSDSDHDMTEPKHKPEQSLDETGGTTHRCLICPVEKRRATSSGPVLPRKCVMRTHLHGAGDISVWSF